MKATATDGLVILHNGRVAYQAYGNGATDASQHILMSATKALVGLLAGVLEARGTLKLDKLVSEYVPEIAHSPYEGATVRHLIDMRTAVAFTPAQQAQYDAATNWEPRGPDTGPSDLRNFFAHLAGPAGEHGGPFRYFSPNTDLLGWAIERATGQTCARLMTSHLWQPMGAEADAYITLDDKGSARCTGGLCAMTRDLARVGQLVVQGGRRAGAEVVPEAWVEDLARGGDRDAWRTGEWGQAFSAISPNMSYRSGWYTIDDEPQTLFAMGIHGQNLFVDRANQIVIAKTSSQAEAMDYRALGLTHQAVPEIRRRLLESTR